MWYTNGVKKIRDMFRVKLEDVARHNRLPIAEVLDTYEQRMERRAREIYKLPPPPGTVRKVDSDDDMIIVWPSRDLTIVGINAWQLYSTLEDVMFYLDSPRAPIGGTMSFLGGTVTVNMQHLLRVLAECENTVHRVEQGVQVEASFRKAFHVLWPPSMLRDIAIPTRLGVIPD